jgi:hypothetical protein
MSLERVFGGGGTEERGPYGRNTAGTPAEGLPSPGRVTLTVTLRPAQGVSCGGLEGYQEGRGRRQEEVLEDQVLPIFQPIDQGYRRAYRVSYSRTYVPLHWGYGMMF